VEYIKKYWKLCIVGILIITNSFIWYAVYQESPKRFTTVAFLNIGQGDSIYIESPTHEKILVDGGPPKNILNELSKVMPFYSRSIDTLIITNPDADHFAGFIDVLDHYNVKRIIEPGTKTDTKTYLEFESKVKEKNISVVIAKRGMDLKLGGDADLKILFPDRDVSDLTTNEGSIVSKLIYKNNSVMLTGDAPNSTEEYVMSLNQDEVKSDVLKAGHHGSRTSASEPFVRAVNPREVVISAGVKNKYGHPHKETVDLFNKMKIPILGTYQMGTIIMKLDGINIETNFK
jgi:competence protein ComEC